MLSDFYDEDMYQGSLFEPEPPARQSEALMTVLDKLNSSGKGKLWFASQGIKQDWSMKRGLLSPQYTTSWVDLPRVK